MKITQLSTKEKINPNKRWDMTLNRIFSKEEKQMSSKHFKTCSTPLTVSKCRLKLICDPISDNLK